MNPDPDPPIEYLHFTRDPPEGKQNIYGPFYSSQLKLINNPHTIKLADS